MAWAVIATMGKWARASGNERILRVASIPSISGIWMSIRIKSNGWFSTASTASLPLFAVVMEQPKLVRMRSATILFTRLSSATSTRSPGFPARFLTADSVFPLRI